MEWAIDVYKRATNPEDKESVLEAIKTTKGDFQQGHMDFTEPVDPNGFHPIANNYKPYIGAEQWVKGTKYAVEPVVVSNAAAPGTTVQAKAPDGVLGSRPDTAIFGTGGPVQAPGPHLFWASGFGPGARGLVDTASEPRV